MDKKKKKKKERKKKKKKGRKKKKNTIEIFAFDLLNSEEKSWNSWATFCIRRAKGFHL